MDAADRAGQTWLGVDTNQLEDVLLPVIGSGLRAPVLSSKRKQ